jgi:Icc-related predicted phosphoesterase
MSVRIVVISDTHGNHDFHVPEGDILIHAGDFTRRGTMDELRLFDAFLRRQPHPHKFVVSGNHDHCAQENQGAPHALLENAVHLLDASAVACGLKIYGSPWQPWFMNGAFNLWKKTALREKWDLIPEGIDILITHTPPYDILDRTQFGWRVGCDELRAAVERVAPRLHVFGHIHEAYGRMRKGTTEFVNAALCNLRYRRRQCPGCG